MRDTFFACRAGISVGSVLIDGAISACPSIRADYHQGNIYENDFMEVWNHRFKPYRDREWMKKDECADCKYFRFCKGNGMHLRDENERNEEDETEESIGAELMRCAGFIGFCCLC